MSERPAPPTREQFKQFYPISTRWNDTDSYGHINNAVHYQLFDTAVNQWLIETGLFDPAQSEAIGLVAETGCRYHGEILFPSVIFVGLRIEHLGRSSVRYAIGLFADDQQVAAADGFFVHVYVDRHSRRPVPISDGLRAAMSGLQI